MSGLNGGFFGNVVNTLASPTGVGSNFLFKGGAKKTDNQLTDPIGLFRKKPVTLAPVEAMPDPDAIAEAKKKSIADQYGRSGRASTVLSGGDTLG